MIKSTSLCFNISSVWKLVIRNEMSYPCHCVSLIVQGCAHSSPHQPTSIGFLRKMKKGSALCVKNLVNLCTKICSISSACFIRMLTRTLFTEGSTRTRSSWFRATVNGLRMSSGEVFASISGTLCLSLACDAKLESERAAVRVLRTQER
jgi:hypothetical protein